MTEEQTNTRIADESQDVKYFTIAPRIIWALSRNPYDYTLWSTIKGIAGEGGECFLSTEDIATLAMMSTGQVSDSRKYWIEVGMLFGELRRDPGYPQPVWHLRIPNVWAANIEWATKYMSLKDRVAFKKQQKENITKNRKNQQKQSKTSLHVVKPSCGEGGVPCGETKNIHKENQNIGAAAPKPEPVWGIAWHLAANVDEIAVPGQNEQAEAKLQNAVMQFSPVYQPFAKAFILATGIFPLSNQVSGWSQAFKDQSASTGLTPQDITDACAQMLADNLTIKDPFSIMNKVPNIRAKRKPATIKPLDTPLTRSAEPKPRQPIVARNQ